MLLPALVNDVCYSEHKDTREDTDSPFSTINSTVVSHLCSLEVLVLLPLDPVREQEFHLTVAPEMGHKFGL